MRKVKLQMQLSLDGFVAGPNGEMDWMTWNWDEKLKQYVADLHTPVDTILLGRKMAAEFIEHWKKAAADPGTPEQEFGQAVTDMQKVIFTRTLQQSKWDRTELATGPLADEIHRLKQQEGGDIIVYGGAGFVSSLIREGLIDEYHLFLNPAIIGEGLAIFDLVNQKKNLDLVKASAFDCGIVVLCYKPSAI